MAAGIFQVPEYVERADFVCCRMPCRWIVSFEITEENMNTKSSAETMLFDLEIDDPFQVFAIRGKIGDVTS